jgi:hypothetical protein
MFSGALNRNSAQFRVESHPFPEKGAVLGKVLVHARTYVSEAG